jgi:esterase/lipase superfamily enzyme
MMRHILVSLLILLLVACAPRGEFVLVDQIPAEKAAAAAASGVREVVFVGTSRKKGEAGAGFGIGRSDAATYLRIDVRVPPDRKVGDVKWPKNARRANPDTEFLTYDETVYAGPEAFRKALRASMKTRGQRDVVVYVHGFNNTMAESVYRVAQMHNDLKVPGVAVHYSWPSRGSPFGYVYDRDSALFARDGLEDLLNQVAMAGADRIIIVAHSMGGALAMESLRQVYLSKDQQVIRHLGGVVLLSPDLDVDVFRSQARGIGKLPEPFIIFGNTRDTVLNISSKLSGAPDRLGNLKDLTQIADLQVTYFDTTAFSVDGGHFNVGNSPALLQLLGGIADIDAAFRAEASARVGLLPGVVLTLRNATGIILAPVEGLATRN